MTSPIKPLGDRVVAVKEKAKEKTSSGLFLPESSKEKPVFAKVISVGPDVKNIKEDDKIIYKEYSTTDLKIDGSDFLIVKEEDILATLK